MKCEHCGATVGASVLECTYCKTLTEEGRFQKELEELAERERVLLRAERERERVRAQVEREERQRAEDEKRMEELDSDSLWWSVAGLVLCCAPVGLVGVAQGLRARALARRLESTWGLGSKLAVGVGSLSSLCWIGLSIWSAVGTYRDQAKAEARVQALEAQAKAGSEAEVLDRETACALAEAYTWSKGYDDTKGYRLKEMRCVGKVTVHGEGAMLESWKFAHGWSSYELAVCFQRTDRWRVTEMKDGYCWPPVKLTLAPTPTITARPSAVPSATASAKSATPPKKAPAKKKPTSPRATEQ